MSKEQLDLIIIGAGPAGISAAAEAERHGMDYLVLEKGLIADTVFNYPIGRTVFSTPNELEMRSGTLKPCREKPTREELLSYYVRFVLDEHLKINTEEEVISVQREEPDGFQVHTARAQYRSSRLLFAVGAMAHPRRLSVPGEDRPKVYHKFTEPYAYVRKNALVVGGGNSAAEATLFLSEEGCYTTLAIWRSDWENRDPKRNAIKPWVRTPLEREIEEGRTRVILFKQVEEIGENTVTIRTEDNQTLTIDNDVVFILVGSDADLRLLRDLGVETVRAGYSEVPVYNPETFETNVSGAYVVGHFTYSRHIKEAIAVPRRIIPLMAKSKKLVAS